MKTVTRQIQFPDGGCVVEISSGGIDYANPGALSPKYGGEFEEFDDPRAAVETAISIAQQWQRDSEDEIFIAHGATGGMTMPFDGEPLDDETFAELREWAEKEFEKLETCVQCGEILGKERFGIHYGEYDCCSEFCAESHYELGE